MSHWSKSFSARLRDTQWKLKHGVSVLNPPRRLKLSAEPAPKPTARAGDDKAEAVASKLPASSSPCEAGPSQPIAKLGLRYER